MEQDTTALYVLLCIIVFFAAVFIIRAVFSIGTIVKNLKAQTILLLYLAKASGMDDKTIKHIEVKTGARVIEL